MLPASLSVVDEFVIYLSRSEISLLLYSLPGYTEAIEVGYPLSEALVATIYLMLVLQIVVSTTMAVVFVYVLLYSFRFLPRQLNDKEMRVDWVSEVNFWWASPQDQFFTLNRVNF